MDEKELREQLQGIETSIREGFAALHTAMEGMEQRLTAQEKHTRKIGHRQRLQQDEIEALKKIVLDLAEHRPIRRMGNEVAIPKEVAYERFTDCGIGKVTATRALRDAGILKVDSTGKCTITIWHEGGCVRVLMVSGEAAR